MKMSIADAKRVAALALQIAVVGGNLQGEPFDTALEKLKKYYDLSKISAKYFQAKEEAGQ